MKEKWTKEFRTFHNNFCDNESESTCNPFVTHSSQENIIYANFSKLWHEEFENRNRIQHKKKLWEQLVLFCVRKK